LPLAAAAIRAIVQAQQLHKPLRVGERRQPGNDAHRTANQVCTCRQPQRRTDDWHNDSIVNSASCRWGDSVAAPRNVRFWTLCSRSIYYKADREWIGMVDGAAESEQATNNAERSITESPRPRAGVSIAESQGQVQPPPYGSPQAWMWLEARQGVRLLRCCSSRVDLRIAAGRRSADSYRARQRMLGSVIANGPPTRRL